MVTKVQNEEQSPENWEDDVEAKVQQETKGAIKSSYDGV